MTIEEDGQLMVHGLNMFPLKMFRIHLSPNFSQIFYCKPIQVIHVCGYRDTSFTKRRNMGVFKRENKAKPRISLSAEDIHMTELLLCFLPPSLCVPRLCIRAGNEIIEKELQP